MLNNLNNIDNENIITKSQIYEKLQPDKMIGDSFAKTINCYGIHSNFCLDIPEIIEEEKRQQERRDDIKKFTRLAVSDIENHSHNQLVEEYLLDNAISLLSNNEDLLRDLGF